MDSLLPGESYGIPNQSGGFNNKLQGLLSNPMFNIGLGILANNNTKNVGQVLGRGALQGLGNIQQQQAFQAQLAQQQQMAEFNKMRQKQMQTEIDQQEKTKAALSGFDERFPQYRGLADIDPKSALRIAYPELASAQNAPDPYFTPIATENGLVSYDNRTGQYVPLNINGKPLVKSTDSPVVRGSVKEAEARATAGYNINTDIPGVVTTARQVAEQVNPALGYPQVTPNVQRGRDEKRMQILLNEQRQAGGAGANPELDAEINTMRGRGFGGLSVPRPEEQAALTESAKTQAEFNSPENVRKRDQAYQFKTTTGNNMLNVLDDVSNRVGKLTAGFGGSILKKLPATDAYDLNADIETIKSNFGFDRLQAMRDMSPTGGALGQVAVQELTALQASVANMDTNQSPAQLKKNLAKAKVHYKNWLNTLDDTQKKNNQLMPSNEPMPSMQAVPLPAKPSTLTLKKGTVYQTPKGALRWNGKAFED